MVGHWISLYTACIISGILPVMEAPHAKGSGVQQAIPITYNVHTFMMEPLLRIRIWIQLGQCIEVCELGKVK